MPSVQIIGGGLYGCLTAYQIAKKYPDLRIDIIEAGDKLLSAFNPITLGGIKFNNGFHGVELPRAESLYNFFVNELDIEMEIRPNQRGLAIKGHLIPFEAGLADWPKELQSLFLKDLGKVTSKDDLDLLISKDYIKFLEKIGNRYSKSTEDVMHLLFPWFFPAGYTTNSDDEGDIFRNKVRNENLKASYGHPTRDLFDVLQAKMKKMLKLMNVNIHFSTEVSFTGMDMNYIRSDDSHSIPYSKDSIVFYCLSSAIMLKGIDPGLFNKLLDNKRLLVNGIYKYRPKVNQKIKFFSEILVADDLCSPLSRISFPTEAITLNGKKLIQCEYFIKSGEDLNNLKDSSPNHINRILSLKGDDKVELLDLQISRAVFFPKLEIQTNAIKIISEWVKSQAINFKMRNNFGPINMAKTWLYAKENANII